MGRCGSKYSLLNSHPLDVDDSHQFTATRDFNTPTTCNLPSTSNRDHSILHTAPPRSGSCGGLLITLSTSDLPLADSSNSQLHSHHRQSMKFVQTRRDFPIRFSSDLLARGDVMWLMNNSNLDWWYVLNSKGEQGYVFSKFVALTVGSESEEWFAGRMQRGLAERLVSSSNLPRGTFLIRNPIVEGEEFALANKDVNAGRGNVVKHYKIKRQDNGEGFFITTRKTFESLRDLVQYHSEVADWDGLCCRLAFPAPRIAPTRPDPQPQNAAEQGDTSPSAAA